MILPKLRLIKEDFSNFVETIQKEWLITNGLGGYASSTVLGVNTRKYHGLLIAALHPPGDRTVCLEKLDEEIVIDKNIFSLGANEFQNVFHPQGFQYLEEFSVSPNPQYIYKAGKVTAAKSHFMLHEKNAVTTTYRIQNEEDTSVMLKINPLVTCRHFHSVVDRSINPLELNQIQNSDNEVQLNFGLPKASLAIKSTVGKFRPGPNWINRIFYREEALRGESYFSDSYQPGFFEFAIPANTTLEFAIVAAVATNCQQCIEILSEAGLLAINPYSAGSDQKQLQTARIQDFYELHPTVPESEWLNWILLSAENFVVKGFGNGISVIAGYHWFEAWGRDTFISLPGLLLVTGRATEARRVLVDFNKFCTLGLIPNFLSDLSLVPSCNTVDATMWHVNSVLQYLKYTGDFDFVRSQLWQSIKEIIENHIVGTSFGIQVDEDGLLSHGPRLTWMDAETNGKAVTPREGKAVEIQALWYNALRIVQLLATEFEEKKLAESYGLLADKTQESFKKKFWNAKRNCLYDAVSSTGPDASLRPNQIIAASLDFAVMDNTKNEQVVDVVQKNLLTPFGLRTLEQSDPRYKGNCSGDRWSRDQAYHNGTVWPWLLGPFTSAFLKAKGVTQGNIEYSLKHFVEPLFSTQIYTAGLGAINEIYDGNAPHTPKGCISQAWSIAEPLRAYIEDILRIRPPFEKQVLSI